MSLNNSIGEDAALEWFEELDYALAHGPQPRQVHYVRLRAVTTEHPFDLSKTLQHQTQAGLMESTGGGVRCTTSPGNRSRPQTTFLAQRPEIRCPAP